jgi:hypothetical protein
MWPFKSKADKELDIMNLLGQKIVSCRTCHALVWRYMAVRGESVVATIDYPRFGLTGRMSLGLREYIDTPYYCLECAPKEEEESCA